MSPAQMKATLAKVDADVRASIQHTENLRRPDRPFAIDESHCTDQKCTTPGCSCQRRTR